MCKVFLNRFIISKDEAFNKRFSTYIFAAQKSDRRADDGKLMKEIFEIG